MTTRSFFPCQGTGTSYTPHRNQLTGLLPLMVFCPSPGSTCSPPIPTWSPQTSSLLFHLTGSSCLGLAGSGRPSAPCPCLVNWIQQVKVKGHFHFLPDSSRLCCWSSKGFLLLFDDFFSGGILLRKPAAEPRQAVASEALPTYAVREQGLVVFLMLQVCM